VEQVEYTLHAREKFRVLQRHGFVVTPSQVEDAVLRPDPVVTQSVGRYIAQKNIAERHVLRVVYRVTGGTRIVITFYPGRRARYAADL